MSAKEVMAGKTKREQEKTRERTRENKRERTEQEVIKSRKTEALHSSKMFFKPTNIDYRGPFSNALLCNKWH